MQTIKRLAINFAHQLLQVWWFIVRPEGRGVKVVLKNGDEVLLVQHNYGHRLWTLPGGGVRSTELPELAAVREIYEELGVVLDRVTFLGQYKTDYEYKKVTVDCFGASIAKETKITIDNFEIAKTQWFPIMALPSERATSVDNIIALYENQQQ